MLFFFFRKIVVFLALLFLSSATTFTENKAGYASLEDDIFNIGNNKIERSFLWNNGNLITLKITDKENGKVWENLEKRADFYIPGQNDRNMKPGTWNTKRIKTPVTNSYLEVTVEYAIERLNIRRVFRIYDDCPAIAIDTYLQGSAKNTWIVQEKNLGVWSYLKQKNIISQTEEIPILDQMCFQGKHWKLNLIEFTDNSDSHNTFVKHHSETAYNDNVYKGNIMFFGNMENDHGLFYLKESPLASGQLAYPGADFIIKYGDIKSIGIGMVASDLQSGEWMKTYSLVFGVSANDELSQLKALHSYHKCKRKQEATKEEMITMNTWGDRGSLERLTENFCFKQIEACAKLGISHFQLDWGWQETSDYIDKEGNPVKKWTPKRSLFPNGFERVVDKGRENVFESPDIIKKYKSIQHEFHKGMILPIGNEPSGKSLTGFQSINHNNGFLLIFREFNKNNTTEIETWFQKGDKLELTPILGFGKKNRQTVKSDGILSVHLPKENSFVLYSYKIIN